VKVNTAAAAAAALIICYREVEEENKLGIIMIKHLSIATLMDTVKIIFSSFILWVQTLEPVCTKSFLDCLVLNYKNSK
jgi:hypothetical protein